MLICNAFADRAASRSDIRCKNSRQFDSSTVRQFANALMRLSHRPAKANSMAVSSASARPGRDLLQRGDHRAQAVLVVVRKRAFLAAVSCSHSGNEIGPVVHLIPSSSNANAGLSTAATDAPHRQSRSPRWITRSQRMVSRRFLAAIYQRVCATANRRPRLCVVKRG